jgi:hypothetical protein
MLILLLPRVKPCVCCMLPHLLPVSCICCQLACQVIVRLPSAGCDAFAGLKALTKLVRLDIAEQDGALWWR